MAGATKDEETYMKTSTDRAPDTIRRPVGHTGDMKLEKPRADVPRALVAVDETHPHGTVGHDHHNYTVLQQHVEFFDRNKDGIIYPWETFSGFRAVGFGWIISFLGMLVVNGTMSYRTQESWIPSPIFSIYIKNVNRAKHGSDSGVYDMEGRFVPSKFEEIFTKFAKTHRDKLTFGELWDMTEAFRDAYDLYGWVANKLEWGLAYWLLKDETRCVPREAIRAVYDGSVFYYLEKKQTAKSISKFF